MTVTYDSVLKSVRMQAVIAALDSGASNAYIELYTAGYALLLVTINLADPSFTEANGVITMANPPRSGVAVANGQAAVAHAHDSNGNIHITGLTVGVASGDIRVNSIDIVEGQTVTISSGTIAHG